MAALWLYFRRRRRDITLTYLDAKGSAEATRLALHIGRVPFVDRRVSYEEVAALRRAGALPCGQVPVLEVDGETYCQSASILRYVGKAAGLYPADPATALRCDMVCDALDELRRDLNPLWCGNSASIDAAPSVRSPRLQVRRRAPPRPHSRRVSRPARARGAPMMMLAASRRPRSTATAGQHAAASARRPARDGSRSMRGSRPMPSSSLVAVALLAAPCVRRASRGSRGGSSKPRRSTQRA